MITTTLISQFNELFELIHYDYNTFKKYDTFTWTIVGLMYLVEYNNFVEEYDNISILVNYSFFAFL